MLYVKANNENLNKSQNLDDVVLSDENEIPLNVNEDLKRLIKAMNISNWNYQY